MSEPKIGDRRPLPPCRLCGGEQYEKYDPEDRWVKVLHLESPGPKYVLDLFPCLKVLSERIKKLEEKSL